MAEAEGKGELGRQALKTRLTRERIINAVIQLINRGGFGAASSSQIARVAGVTWGAVQHHFGSKDDIMLAVLDLSHERFTEKMQRDELMQGSVAERVDLFVQLVWEHYQSDLYLAALEILLATRDSTGSAGNRQTRRQTREHIKTMKRVFKDIDLTDAQRLDVLVFVHTFLTGLTIERVFETTLASEARNLGRIKAAMLTMLTG